MQDTTDRRRASPLQEVDLRGSEMKRKTTRPGALGWMCGTALASGVFMGICAPATSAMAQTTPAAAPSASDTTMVGEIMDQATRRTERLQDVPEAVAVI